MLASQRRQRAAATQAAAQLYHGVLSRQQLQALGWTPDALRHAVANGQLARLTEQVFTVSTHSTAGHQVLAAGHQVLAAIPRSAASPQASTGSHLSKRQLSVPHQDVIGLQPALSLDGWRIAGLLAAGDGAALAGHWAGQLHGLRGRPELPVDVIIPAERLPTAAPFVTARRRTGLDVVHHAGFLCLSPEEVTLDAAAVATDFRDVVGVLTDALGRGVTTTRKLAARAEARPRLRWRREITAVLRDVAAGMASLLEICYGTIERRHRLPLARRQVATSRDGRRTRADGLIDAVGVFIELDGRQGHQGEGAFRDRSRDNWGARHGYVTLRYGYQELFGAPCAVAAEVIAVCIDRGWRGRPRSCGRGCDVTRWER